MQFQLSVLLTSLQVDAYLCGPVKKLSSEYILGDAVPKFQYSFHKRIPKDRDSQELTRAKQKILLLFQTRLRFGLAHPNVICAVGETGKSMAVPKGGWNGITFSNVDKNFPIFLVLNYNLLLPLLRNDLTISERLSQQLYCAEVFLHELMVSGAVIAPPAGEFYRFQLLIC